MRNLFGKELKGKVDYFISVDDAGLGIASRAVGSYRYRVTYKGPGGHSYGAFGIPNPIHALGRAIAGISDIQVPANPKTTFNVGVIQGGTSVNSIAGEASMEVDMRSEDAKSLADGRRAGATHHPRCARRRERAVDRAARRRAAKIALVVDTIGIRPTGGQADSARDRADGARRRQGARLHLIHDRVEHRREHSDLARHSRHPHRRRWRRAKARTRSANGTTTGRTGISVRNGPRCSSRRSRESSPVGYAMIPDRVARLAPHRARRRSRSSRRAPTTTSSATRSSAS